ncbi:MAG: GYF domain-containing protein [Parvibaculum sp.]|uniref:GYF domain-containing protein n=1 Tax=Parvibaculum sp. TaxID=2024848 RepID=UPI0027212203|nr:GYF domain-containing protein [Parvibaculum sp.]MDO8839589.1 GYF domain-containing protein [Parvibaculum sp.]
MAQSNEVLATRPDGQTDEPALRWVLKHGDRVYGPYSFAAMKAYAAEGRVAPHSLVAPEGTPAGAGTWRAAGDLPQLAVLFGHTPEIEPEPQHDPVSTPADEPDLAPAADAQAETIAEARAQPALEPATQPEPDTTPRAGDPRRQPYGSGKGQIDRRAQPESANFLIVLDIKARFAGPLEQAIMSLGPAYKLAANVWCVNADATAPGLLNDLSVHIGKTDSMFIADTTRDRTAWSSMGPEVDAKIRRVWRRTY